MHWRVCCVLAALAACGLTGIAGGQDHRPATDPRVRIGVYESRAIAVAWAASTHNPVAEKMKELEVAKREKDSQRMAQLEAWGQAHQRQLHFQGFGRVPVNDLLQPVHAGLVQIMREKQVTAITMQCDAVAEGVELVDVTMDLVQLFAPSERTLTWIKQLREHEPLSLDELAKLPADK